MKKLIISVLFVFAFSFFAPLIIIEAGFERVASIYAQTKDQCREQLDKAEEEYQAGKWTETIQLIEQCLSKDNVGELERGRAYRILGLVYIAIQLEKEANEAVKNLLIMVPNYKVDPVKDPPSLKNIIEKMAATLNPQIEEISPDSKEKGEPGFTMTVKGSNFVYGSVIRFNKENKQTTWISDKELKAQIPASDLLQEGKYVVNVYNPILGGKTSNTEKFIINPASSGFPWTWIAVGGGAVAAVVAAIVLLGGDETTETIVDPPGRPK